MKTKKILVVRTVSFEQLDRVIKRLKEDGPMSVIMILTHSHGKDMAAQYFGKENIFVYNRRGNYTLFHLPRELSGHVFDEVILPVTNLRGNGFFNVFLFSVRVSAKKRYIMNVNLKKRLLTYRLITGSFVLRTLYFLISILLSGAFGIVLLGMAGLYGGFSMIFSNLKKKNHKKPDAVEINDEKGLD